MAARAVFLLLALAAASAQASKYPNQVAGILLGDWGGQDTTPYTEKGQVACVPGMSQVADSIGAESVFLLGDNFYSYGIQGDAHSPRFKETFEDVYNTKELESIPNYYVVAGNHDHRGNVSAQIAYSQLSSRWNFPNFYYVKTFVPDDKSFTMDVVFIDTVLLAGNSDDLEDKFGELPGPSNQALADSQWKFIEDALKNSKADYLFAAGHYPVWSGCSHGPTPILVSTLKPLLEKYNASGYLSGHDHCLEHIEDGSGVQYILTGAGDNCCYKNDNVNKCPKGSIKFAVWDDGTGAPMLGGFGSFVASKDHMTVTYHAANGTKLYTAPWIQPRQL